MPRTKTGDSTFNILNEQKSSNRFKRNKMKERETNELNVLWKDEEGGTSKIITSFASVSSVMKKNEYSLLCGCHLSTHGFFQLLISIWYVYIAPYMGTSISLSLITVAYKFFNFFFSALLYRARVFLAALISNWSHVRGLAVHWFRNLLERYSGLMVLLEYFGDMT